MTVEGVYTWAFQLPNFQEALEGRLLEDRLEYSDETGLISTTDGLEVANPGTLRVSSEDPLVYLEVLVSGGGATIVCRGGTLDLTAELGNGSFGAADDVELKSGGGNLAATIHGATQNVTFEQDVTVNGTSTHGLPLVTTLVNLTLNATHGVVLCASVGNITITLPAVASNTNHHFWIKNITNTTVTVDANASETIDGNLTQSLTQYEVLHIVCDGTEWWII